MTRKQTTVKVGGKRIRLVTMNGKTTATDAPVPEWELQAAAIKAQRAMPEYAASPEDVRPGMFTLAGDFNAARRSMQESVKARATGITAGEHDERVYMYGGRLGLIEYKGKDTPVSGDQKKRHALLAALGFDRQAIIRASTPEECAAASVACVRRWLTASDDKLNKIAA